MRLQSQQLLIQPLDLGIKPLAGVKTAEASGYSTCLLQHARPEILRACLQQAPHPCDTQLALSVLAVQFDQEIARCDMRSALPIAVEPRQQPAAQHAIDRPQFPTGAHVQLHQFQGARLFGRRPHRFNRSPRHCGQPLGGNREPIDRHLAQHALRFGWQAPI